MQLFYIYLYLGILYLALNIPLIVILLFKKARENKALLISTLSISSFLLYAQIVNIINNFEILIKPKKITMVMLLTVLLLLLQIFGVVYSSIYLSKLKKNNE